jgi:hypothetical protein
VVRWLIGYFVKYRGFFANCPLPIANSFFDWSSGEVVKWSIGYFVKYRGFFANYQLPAADFEKP